MTRFFKIQIKTERGHPRHGDGIEAAARDKRRKPESDTDSDDSAVLMAKLKERDRRKKAKVELKAKQDEEAAILKMLNDQTAKNARRLKEPAASYNLYQVIL